MLFSSVVNLFLQKMEQSTEKLPGNAILRPYNSLNPWSKKMHNNNVRLHYEALTKNCEFDILL